MVTCQFIVEPAAEWEVARALWRRQDESTRPATMRQVRLEIFQRITAADMSGQSVRVLPPQSFKACRIARGIAHRVLNVPMPQVVLNQPCIRALIG